MVSELFGRRTLSLLLDRSTLFDLFEMAYVGPGNYVVVVLFVGGSKASLSSFYIVDPVLVKLSFRRFTFSRRRAFRRYRS
jgi:hypothetical protein